MNKAKCGSWMAKVFLLIFNFFLFAIGATLVGVGAWVASDDIAFLDLEFVKNLRGGNLLQSSAILLLSVGCFTVIVSIFGFVVAFGENPYFFAMYIVGLAICWVGMLIGGSLAIAFKDQVINNIGGHLLNDLRNIQTEYYNISPNGECLAWRGFIWDNIQKRYDCCGVGDSASSGYNDYVFTTNSSCNGKVIGTTRVPFSCCSNFDKITKFNPDQYEKDNCYLNKDGCGQRIVNAVYKFSPILVGLGLGFGMFMMFGIVFAVCLCQNPTKNL